MTTNEKQIFPISSKIAASAHCDEAKYKQMYAHSINDAEGFWADQAQTLDWIKKWSFYRK